MRYTILQEVWQLLEHDIEKEHTLPHFSPADVLVIREYDRSANKLLRLKRCLNARNNKPLRRTQNLRCNASLFR